MKAALICLFVLMIAMFGQAASYSYTSTQVGDVRIQTLINGSLYCDSLICPPGTAACKVTKRNDPNNFQVIIRHRSCLNGVGASLAEEVVNEENRFNSNVNTQIISGGGFQSVIGGNVRQMTPEEQRQLEESLRRTEQRVQNEISGAMNQLQNELAPFLDGSFAANLNNQIRSSIRNAFR